MSKISFTSHGYRLSGNLFKPTGEAKPLAFLLIQGWTGHQNLDAAQALTELGYATMTYDMRGHGDSEGNLADFSRADFIDDAVVAYDYLKEQVGDGVRIGVVGSSFGGYTAALLSKRRAVECLSLRVPANYPDAGFDSPQLAQRDEDAMSWRHQQLTYEQNTTLAALHDFKGAVQIIEAGADKTVPSQGPQNYADAMADKSKLTYEIVPNAPHRLENDELKADYIKRLTAWVKELT